MRYDSVARCAMRGASSPAAAMPAVLVIFTPGKGERAIGGLGWWVGTCNTHAQQKGIRGECDLRLHATSRELRLPNPAKPAAANPLANNRAQRSPPPSLCMTRTACSARHAARRKAASAACQPWFQTLPGMYSSVSTEGLLRSGKGEEEGKGQRCV